MGTALRKLPDHDTIGKMVAERIIALVQDNPRAVIGLATGDTPKPIYAHIVRRCQEAAASGHPIDFSQATFFALDEYVGLAPEHPQSYHHYLWSKLLGPIGADKTRVHIPDGNAADTRQACREYEAALRRAGKVDLWIVGLGENGHIAFNEPNTAFNSRTHRIKLTPSTLAANAKHFKPGETMPTEAITVGLGTLREYAREVAFVVNGPKKAPILAKLLNGGVHNKLPASLLKTMKNVTAYADEAALSRYEARGR